MPELPDITVYVEALERRILARRLKRVRVASPFLLRTVEPPIDAAEGLSVVEIRRLGKRIALGLEGDLWLVLHLMIAGRLHWKPAGAKIPGRLGLAAFDFEKGTLLLTEAGSKRRASLHFVRGQAGLAQHDPGGIETLGADLALFSKTLRTRNHTLKRALTDPSLFSGIGSVYSEEILHAARLSPLALTQKLGDDEVERLFEATYQTLRDWVD